jgi:hypothetical protein
VEEPEEVGLKTEEALASKRLTRAFVVAGAGFEPATFGI